MKMNRGVFFRCLENPGTLELDERRSEPAQARATDRLPKIDGHSRGMDRVCDAVLRLHHRGPYRARHHEGVAARREVLARETSNEGERRRADEGKADIVHDESRRGPQWYGRERSRDAWCREESL